MEMSKDIFLNQLKTYIPADDYVMVENIKGVSGASDDEGVANPAGWRFIKFLLAGATRHQLGPLRALALEV